MTFFKRRLPSETSRSSQSRQKSTAWKIPLALSATFIAVACSYVVPPVSSDQADQPFTLSPAEAQTTKQTASPTAAPSNWASVEQALITEHNRVRQNPSSYIPILEAHLAKMDADGNIPNGCGRNCTLLSNEGRPAVEEAIRYLRNQPAVGAVTLSNGIAQAAKAHARDQRGGSIGHTGSDGSQPQDRLARFGVQNSGSGENIAYGPTTAQSIMLNLIVDDGVANRGHRTNIFSRDWTMAGAGCDSHSVYGAVCVIDYAKAPRGASAADRQFRVVNNGSVELRSLQIAGTNVLGSPLAVGQSRTIPLSNSCRVNLTIQLGGNYRPLAWNDLDLCAATFTVDGRNRFQVSYGS
jgi:uncharacterized protein YkwD